MSLSIGLTGGIASGKSLVASLFAEQGVTIIDADLVARDVVAPGQPGLTRLVELFGDDILDADGMLDRRRMRERVFSDPDARHTLESVLHPLIRAELARRRDAGEGDYQILAIPLLARTGMGSLVDRVLVVDVPESVQLERLVLRDGISPDLAQRMLAAQETREQRLALADDVLLNDGPPERLQGPVAFLHDYYRRLAQGLADTGLRLHLPADPVR